MELTHEEAVHLIEQLTEMVFWSDDPLHYCTMIESSLLAKATEAYPGAANQVRLKREEERKELIKINQKEKEEN